MTDLILPGNMLASLCVLSAVIGVSIGLLVHFFSSQQRRARERMFLSLGYGLAWGLAVSVLALVAADNLGWLSAKLAPVAFGICLGICGGISGILALSVMLACGACASKFARPAGRPTVNWRVERKDFRSPRS